MSDYKNCLEKAGADVLAFKEFGSYQGEWWAKVKYHNQILWVNGSYGSCSGCDSYQAEFGYSDCSCDKHRYSPEKDCISCIEAQGQLLSREIEFGKKLILNASLTIQEAINKINKDKENNVSYHCKEDDDMHEFVISNSHI